MCIDTCLYPTLIGLILSLIWFRLSLSIGNPSLLNRHAHYELTPRSVYPLYITLSSSSISFSRSIYLSIYSSIQSKSILSTYLSIHLRVAERWLNHMYDTLEELEVVDEFPVINEDCRDMLMNYFRHTAYLMVAAQEEQWKNYYK